VDRAATDSRNQGVNSMVDIPVSSDSPVGTEHGTQIVVGGETVFKASAKSDGAGGVDSVKITAQAIKLTDGAGYRKIPISRNSLGDIKYTASAYLDTAFVNRLLVATAANVIGQLPLGTDRKMLMGITDSVPKWKVPTTYDITPTANRRFITPADTIRLDSLQTYLSMKKDLSDSTDTDGYTRRDRLSTELFKKQKKDSTTVLDYNTYGGNAYLMWSIGTGGVQSYISPTKIIFNPYAGNLWFAGDLMVNTTAKIGIGISEGLYGTAGQVLTSGGDGSGIYWSDKGSGMTYPSAGIALSTGSAWGTSITDNSSNWNTSYTDRLKWDGGATDLNASTARASLGLGGYAVCTVVLVTLQFGELMIAEAG